jgi:hypothetical protein
MRRVFSKTILISQRSFLLHQIERCIVYLIASVILRENNKIKERSVGSDLPRLRCPKIQNNIFLYLPRLDPFIIPALRRLKPPDMLFEIITFPDALDSPLLRLDLKINSAAQSFAGPFGCKV